MPSVRKKVNYQNMDLNADMANMTLVLVTMTNITLVMVTVNITKTLGGVLPLSQSTTNSDPLEGTKTRAGATGSSAKQLNVVLFTVQSDTAV